jgi:hypothetical protein
MLPSRWAWSMCASRTTGSPASIGAQHRSQSMIIFKLRRNW